MQVQEKPQGKLMSKEMAIQQQVILPVLEKQVILPVLEKL